MAMAEVYRPESDDRLSPYPRAPPPSPEAQHRTLEGIFELPPSMFDKGFGIDLRRRDFDFSESDDYFPPSPPVHEPSTVRRSSPKRAASSDTDDSDYEQPGSPMKRMCSAPSTMPNSFEVQGFQPGLLTSTTSASGDSSLLQPVSTGDIKVSIPNFSKLAAFNSHSSEHAHSHSHSTSPTLFQQQHQNQQTMSSPYSIPPRSTGSVTPTHKPTTQPYDSSHLLSRSFDLHNVQSHFPANFEVTPPPPEVRPTRAHTLDASTYSHESPIIRTRKVSLKRNFGELESEPNLQFPFDYSYSSTGSSGESDWVVIESDLSSYPQGKKACCQQEPISSAAAVAMSKRCSGSLTAKSSSPIHASSSRSASIVAYSTTTAAVGNGNSLNQEGVLLQSHEAAAQFGQSSSPLGVSTSSSAGADLSTFPGGSAASNGSGSHSPLHTQLGMIHEDIGPGSSAELHSATSASAGYGQMPTADAALAERSHRGEFVPQWSMEMMDCGDYSNRLDSIDSMDCGQASDPAVTMQSLGGQPDGQYSADLDDSLLFSNYYGQFAHHPQGLLNPSSVHIPPPPQPHLVQPHHVARSHSSEASLRGGSDGVPSNSSRTATRHSFIENYFNSYHNNQSALPGGVGLVGEGGQVDAALGTEGSSESRLNFSKSL